MWYYSVVSASPGSLLQMQPLRHHHRSNVSATDFNKKLQWFVCTLKFQNHCAKFMPSSGTTADDCLIKSDSTACRRFICGTCFPHQKVLSAFFNVMGNPISDTIFTVYFLGTLLVPTTLLNQTPAENSSHKNYNLRIVIKGLITKCG